MLIWSPLYAFSCTVTTKELKQLKLVEQNLLVPWDESFKNRSHNISHVFFGRTLSDSNFPFVCVTLKKTKWILIGNWLLLVFICIFACVCIPWMLSSAGGLLMENWNLDYTFLAGSYRTSLKIDSITTKNGQYCKRLWLSDAPLGLLTHFQGANMNYYIIKTTTWWTLAWVLLW